MITKQYKVNKSIPKPEKGIPVSESSNWTTPSQSFAANIPPNLRQIVTRPSPSSPPSPPLLPSNPLPLHPRPPSPPPPPPYPLPIHFPPHPPQKITRIFSQKHNGLLTMIPTRAQLRNPPRKILEK
jgi:hypothetical protein